MTNKVKSMYVSFNGAPNGDFLQKLNLSGKIESHVLNTNSTLIVFSKLLTKEEALKFLLSFEFDINKVSFTFKRDK